MKIITKSLPVHFQNLFVCVSSSLKCDLSYRRLQDVGIVGGIR